MSVCPDYRPVTERMPDDIESPPDELGAIDEGELADVDSEVRNLIEALRTETDAALRLVVRYTADDYEVLFAREDVTDQFPGAELRERVETLVMKGLGDPPRESTLFDFGSLDATVRFYENAHVVHLPYREWSGFVFVLERQAAPLVDMISDHLGE
jgi:hypothetical protein